MQVRIQPALVLAVQLAALAAVAPASAQEGRPEFFEGAKALSIAGANRALGTSNDAIYLNPAAMVFTEVYSIEAGYQDDFHGQTRTFSSSVMDTQAGPVSAGMGYIYSERHLDNKRKLVIHRGDLALAARVHEQISVGVTARYQDTSESVDGNDVDGGGYNMFNLDAGVAWQSDFGLSIGLAAYNLTNSDRPEFPIAWGAGIGFGYEWFMIEADIRYNAQKGRPRFSGGAGVVIYDMIPVRAGVSYDRLDESVNVTAGIGYVHERVGLDITWKQRVVHGNLPEDAVGDRIFAAALRTTFE